MNGLDLYNKFRKPLSQMTSTEDMDAYVFDFEDASVEAIKDCIECAHTNMEDIPRLRTMFTSTSAMDWDLVLYYDSLIVAYCRMELQRLEEQSHLEEDIESVIETASQQSLSHPFYLDDEYYFDMVGDLKDLTFECMNRMLEEGNLSYSEMELAEALHFLRLYLHDKKTEGGFGRWDS